MTVTVTRQTRRLDDDEEHFLNLGTDTIHEIVVADEVDDDGERPNGLILCSYCQEHDHWILTHHNDDDMTELGSTDDRKDAIEFALFEMEEFDEQDILAPFGDR